MTVAMGAKRDDVTRIENVILVSLFIVGLSEVFSIFNAPILVFGDSFLTIDAPEIHPRVVTFDSARKSLQWREEATERRFRKNHCYLTIQFLVV